MLQNETVKRYNTYKNSGIEWIGEIPQEWNTITLKRVFSNRDGGAWGEEPQNNENDRICIRIADFDYPKMTVKHDIDFTVRNYTTDVIEKLTLQKNDILIEKSGGGDQTPVGRTIIFNEDFNALYANFMDRLRVKQSISPKFIQYLLVSFYQNGITYQYIKQTTGIQNLDLTNLLAKESIVLPTLNVQQRIADYLDKKCGEIDRVVETEKAVIEKLKEYKQSIITEAVTKGLDKSVPLKDSGIEWIGKIPQHWEMLKLKYIAECNREVLSENTEPDKCIDYIEIGSVTNESGINGYETLTFGNAPSRARRIVNNGDTIISTVRTYLKAIAYIDDKYDKFICSTGFAVFTPNKKVLPKFLFHALHSEWFVSTVEANSVGISYPAINTTNIVNYKIAIPSVKEQEQILKYLDKKCSEIDKAIADKEQVIEKFTEYKKSLIYECVTGKRKVVE